MSATVGYVRGTLRLDIGTGVINLGDVSLPLVTETPAMRHSGDEPPVLRLKADTGAVRDAVQAIFSEGPSDE